MAIPLSRTVCEKCGRVTLVTLFSEVSVYLSDEPDGRRIYVTLCPEHKAELTRLISDFFEGVQS
jgi:hypothetical protein